MLDQVRTYFKQQEELYGDTLVLHDTDILTREGMVSKPDLTLDEFHRQIQNCQACSLGATRTHFVFGEGNPNANLMLIGEAPGEEEDKQGRPFVGQAGQLLDKILAAIDFDRKDVFICNILKCRPPQNRDPQPEEIDSCLPYLEKQIDLIQPKMILALGRIPAHVLLNTQASLNEMRQTVHRYRDIPVFVTYHPAALLRNTQWKRPVWEDVQKLRHLYDETVGDKPKWQSPRK